MTIDGAQAIHALPHPLAVLHDLTTDHDAHQRLRATLSFMEGVAHFLAWVLVADAAAGGAPTTKLREWMKSNSFGRYLHAMESCRRLRDARPDRHLPELDALLDAATPALARARDLRNDEAHHRLSADPVSVRERLAAVDRDLAEVRAALGLFQAHPLGVVRALSNRADGTLFGQWYTLRGLSLRSGGVEVPGMERVPLHAVVLLDTTRARALTLGPFMLCEGDSFFWYEPASAGNGERGVYRTPLPTPGMLHGAPRELADVHRLRPQGMDLDAWLGDPTQRPRIIPLELSASTLELLRVRAQPTFHGLRLAPPAVAVAPAPPPAAFPSQPPSVHGAVAPPPVPARRVSPAAGIALAVMAVVGVAVAGAALRGRSAGDASGGARARAEALNGHPSLVDWVRSWDPNRADDERLRERYLPAVSFHGRPRPQDPASIVNRWRERLAQSTFHVDLERSQVYAEPANGVTVPSACRDAAGVQGEVTTLLLHAREEGRPISDPRGRLCTRVEGRYLLRLRDGGGGLRVCHESWMSSTLCASCPQMCAR